MRARLVSNQGSLQEGFVRTPGVNLEAVKGKQGASVSKRLLIWINLA
jgi:hypothetical protein